MFVNLPVRDLKRSMELFAELGFELEPTFTDDKAACMIVSEHAWVMLLAEPFFRRFTKKEVCDTAGETEALFALSCRSRADVDALARRALAAGAKPAMDPQDRGYLYARSFYDLDGHHWDVLWLNPRSTR
jgi:predicted lactoylglutathione lyase